METAKSFGGNHNLAYDDYELFGLPGNFRKVDTSAFEELFGENESRSNTKHKPEHKAKMGVNKDERKPAGKDRRLFKVLSGLMTMSFIMLLFSIIVS